MTDPMLAMLKQMAKALAAQFGPGCEIAIHDLKKKDIGKSLVYIENGHVSGRHKGDGPSRIVLEALKKDPARLRDQLGYLTKSADGKVLKSSTVYVRDSAGDIRYVFGVNYDITDLLYIEQSLRAFTSGATQGQAGKRAPSRIVTNVNDLLDDLIAQSMTISGKPVALMTKEDKIAAIQFLNDSGAFLITKSGDKVSQHFGISKFTLYNYLETAGNGKNAKEKEDE